MKTINYLLIFLLFLNSGYSEIRDITKSLKLQPKKIIDLKPPRDGAIITRNFNGKIESIKSFEGGELHGRLIVFDESGNRVRESLYQDGKLMQKTSFYPNGMTREVLPIVDGKIHGISISYYQNGKLSGLTEWSDGTQNGESPRFDKNGKKIKVIIWKSGKIIDTRKI